MQSFLTNNPVSSIEINLSKFGITGNSLVIAREDLIHPFVSGNKFRKLKYNILAAHEQKHHTMLTFGGAYSNHIAASGCCG